MVVTPCPTESYSDFSPWDLLNYETLSLDRILDFVEMIENTDNLEEIFTEQQIEEIQKFKGQKEVMEGILCQME